MALTTPLSEKNPERWVLRFLSHFVIGLIAWHSLIWIASPVAAVPFVAVVYFVSWEALVQRIEAGWWDALLDTWAVALGALTGLEILTGPSPPAFVGLMVAGAATLGHGIWRRRR